MESLSPHHINYYENSIWPMQQTFKNRKQNIILIINSSPHTPILTREIKVTEEEIAPSYRGIHTGLPPSLDFYFPFPIYSSIWWLHVCCSTLRQVFYSTLTGSWYLQLTASLWVLNQLAFSPNTSHCPLQSRALLVKMKTSLIKNWKEWKSEGKS